MYLHSWKQPLWEVPHSFCASDLFKFSYIPTYYDTLGVPDPIYLGPENFGTLLSSDFKFFLHKMIA